MLAYAACALLVLGCSSSPSGSVMGKKDGGSSGGASGSDAATSPDLHAADGPASSDAPDGEDGNAGDLAVAVDVDSQADVPAGDGSIQADSDAGQPGNDAGQPAGDAAAGGDAGGPQSDASGSDPNSCSTGGGVSATPVLMAECATEGAFGYVQDGNIPFVCARGPANAQKPACLRWRRGIWYLQTRGKIWNSDEVDLGRSCSTLGQRSPFPGGTMICSTEPKTQTLQWALSVGDDLLPYVRWDPTETFLPIACKPPMDTSNGSQFYRATVDVDPHDSQTLYLNIEWIGPFRSRDGGATWAPFNIVGRAVPARTTTGVACHGEYPGFGFDQMDASHLYFIAGGAPGSEITTPLLQGGGLWDSTDGGGNFRWLGAPQLNQYVSAFVRSGDGKTLLWGTTSSLGSATGTKPPTPQTKGLIYRSDDAGTTWRELPTGLWPESTASFLWLDPGNSQHYLLGVFQYLQRLGASDAHAPGLLQTLDGGTTWIAVSGVNTADNSVTAENTVVAPDGQLIFSCGLGTANGPACSRSENSGTTFAPAEALSGVALDPLDTTHQRLVGYRLAGGTPTIPIAAAVMLSLDGGRNWSTSSALPTAHPGRIQWDPSVKDRIYLTGDAGEIYRSNDAGAHWTKLTTYIDFIGVPRTD